MDAVASIGGLISGLKTDDIVTQLIQFDRQPILQYQAQQAVLKQHLAAYQEANTRLQAVQTAASSLALASSFDVRTAASSNPGVVTATANSGATPGNYSVTIDTLAQAHQVISQSFSDIDTTTIGTGTFTVTSGGQSTTIQVDAGNNTLGGLRDAINRANTNISASIVRDGDSSYRLLISSKQTGTANALTITNNVTGGAGPTFSDLQAAQDAKVFLGSGVNAIQVVRSTNSIQDLIPGVTLNLLSASPNTPVTVSVTQDTKSIQDSLQKLVDQYNNAVQFINDQSKFNPDTKTGGVLLGDFTLRNVQNDLAEVFSTSVAGSPTGLNSLADIGVSLDGTGMLSLDTDKLQSVLASNPDGVAQVLALTAKSTNSSVQLIAAGPKTLIDGTAFAVNITQTAQQARVTAGTAMAGPLGADETLTINGTDIQLTAGMTEAEVVNTINARSSQTGVKAKLTAADGTGAGSYLSLFANSYGSTSKVTAISSRSGVAGDSTGLGNVTVTESSAGGETGGGTGNAGVDVAGTINGEAATGKGLVLIGNSGNATTDGLRLQITGTAIGALGTIQLFDGIAHKASSTLDRITDALNGPIQGEEDSLNQRIKDLQDTIDRREEESKSREDALRAKFNNLESVLGQLQSQSSQLSAQLAKL